MMFSRSSFFFMRRIARSMGSFLRILISIDILGSRLVKEKPATKPSRIARVNGFFPTRFPTIFQVPRAQNGPFALRDPGSAFAFLGCAVRRPEFRPSPRSFGLQSARRRLPH
jgi:hypothetical protein